MLKTTKKLLTDFTKNNRGVGLFDTGTVMASPESLASLIEDIVEIETKDAYERGRFAKQTVAYQTGADDFLEIIVRWTDVSFEKASNLRKLM